MARKSTGTDRLWIRVLAPNERPNPYTAWIAASCLMNRTHSATSYFSKSPSVTSSPPLTPCPRLSGNKQTNPCRSSPTARGSTLRRVPFRLWRSTTALPFGWSGCTRHARNTTPSAAVMETGRQDAEATLHKSSASEAGGVNAE